MTETEAMLSAARNRAACYTVPAHCAHYSTDFLACQVKLRYIFYSVQSPSGKKIRCSPNTGKQRIYEIFMSEK